MTKEPIQVKVFSRFFGLFEQTFHLSRKVKICQKLSKKRRNTFTWIGSKSLLLVLLIFWYDFRIGVFMALPPQKFREIVYQILFSASSASFDPERVEDTALMLMAELKVTKRSVLDACEKSKKILSHLGEIDERIKNVSREYQFDRITSAEKCVLRLAFFELFYDSSLPPPVVIAEAIRLTRKFGTPESADFVNAILDSAQRVPTN